MNSSNPLPISSTSTSTSNNSTSTNSTSSSSTSSTSSHHLNSNLIPSNPNPSNSIHQSPNQSQVNTIIDIDHNHHHNHNLQLQENQSHSPIPIPITSTYLHHSHHHHYYHHHHHQEPTSRTNSIDQLLNLHLPLNHQLINQLRSSPSTSSHQPHNHIQDPQEADEDDHEEDDDEEDSSSSYLPRSSLVVEDYDERGFGSSAESDVSSSGLLDEPGETTRMLKRKNSNPIPEPSSASSRAESPTPLPSLYWSSSQSNTSVPLHPHHHSQGPSSNIGEPDYLLTDASSTCLAQLGDPHSSLSNNQSSNVLVNDGHSNRYHSQYFHSHHYRTSALPRKNPSHLPTHYAPSQSSLSGVESVTPRGPSNTSTDSPRRSKRGWFSSRRQKRKNSIHALSTSSLSSTSLHSPPFHDSKQEFHSTKQHEYKYQSSSSRRSRSSPSTLRRMSRSLQSLGLSSIFFARQVSIPTRRPITIFVGLIIIIGLIAAITTFLIHFLDTDKEPLPWRTYCQEQREFPHEFADSLAPVNVFVGVFSIDSAYERRHLIRTTYARHSRPIDPATGRPAHNVQLKFVLGKPRIQHARRVALEMETFNDIVILEIPENMNRGKTYAYFRWASENATIPFYYHSTSSRDPNEPLQLDASDEKQNPKVSVGFRKADFVVKADDDAFIVLRELERHLRVAPRNKTYWGYLIRNLFMGGECYALSSDLVDYVASSASVLNHLTGAEDKKVAKWMRIHPNATSINWVTEKCWIYDHPKAGTTYAHGFLFPDEVRRVREEGKRGLTTAELAMRGYDWPQAYSTVTRWKERYLPPRSRMTMEEEVEALVEGGGKFNRTDWRSSDINQKPLIRIDEVLFEANDQRLQLPTTLSTLPEEMRTKGVAEHGTFSSGAHSSSALLSPSVPHEAIPLKFGRPPSELLAPLPAYEDLPESDFKQALGRLAKDNERVGLNHKEDKMIELPSVRFDEDENRLREIRFEGRKHGGTVVVHYLKRNEWFLETQLVLLGKSYTWDSGLEPTDHLARIEKAAIGTKEKLEIIQSGNERFGGARMYGSPLIEPDGTIKVGEAGKVEEVQEPDLAIRKTIEGGAGWVRGKPRVRVSDLENGPDFSLGKEEEKEEEKVEEEMSEIVENSGSSQSHLTSSPLSPSLSSDSTTTLSSDVSRVDQQIRLPDDQSEILNNRPTLEYQPDLDLNNTGIDI